MKVRVIYRLEVLSGMLIGATAEALSIGIDKTTVRRRRVIPVQGREAYLNTEIEQEPLIPGSTLKGKIRHECERILTTLGQDICRAPKAETMCPHDPRRDGHSLCAACQLFGGPSNQGRLFFSDAVMKSDVSLGRAAFRIQAGVSISRKRRTAEDERLYHLERGVENLTHEGIIDGYLDTDLAERQVALLIAAIKQLVALGSGKSRGAGWTSSEILNVEMDGREIGTEQLEKILLEGLNAWRASK
jgi:CRISPR/Cas system CSM-associated protein Csm3 (group 7 of RAMP superfamily)